MGLFQRRRTDPIEIERLKEELAALRVRLDAADAAKSELGERVGRIDERLASPLAPPPPPGRSDNAAAVDAPGAEVAKLDEHLNALDERVAVLDERITSVSTELANQLSELGNEIDALARRGDGGVGDEAVEALRMAQTKLANEQARYQIAFREDLAALAEKLRRPGS
jgi:chromosome segregation ATPase